MVAETTTEKILDFDTYTKKRRSLIEKQLAVYLDNTDPEILWDSMRYSVLSGGKRLRALLCLASAEAITGSHEIAIELAVPCACAVEMVHAMSLIHDDLPCLDNDDLRRGKPTNHKVYGEAIALLAGDALLIMAAETLLKESSRSIDPAVLLEVTRELTSAAGAQGMVGGQVMDMALTGLSDSPDKGPVSADTLKKMHARKTGALIRFAAWSGAKLAGASGSQLQSFSDYGESLGLAFQITDDLLDVTGDAKSLGKTPGKDAAADKTTWVRLFGEETSRQQLKELESKGMKALSSSGLVTDRLTPLISLLNFAINRTN